MEALNHSLQKMKAEAPGDTLRNVFTEALVESQVDSLAEVKAKRVKRHSPM